MQIFVLSLSSALFFVWLLLIFKLFRSAFAAGRMLYFNPCYIMLFFSLMLLCRWISVGSDLKFDARRDLDDVGAAHVEGKSLSLS